MTRDQKSIIQRAKRDGLLPMQLAEELMAHDLLELMLDQMKSHAVAFKNMSEIQQDSAIATMQEGLKDAIKTAMAIISSGATKTVRMSLKGVAAGKKLKITGEVSASEEFKHELIDAATDQADVLVILNERDFLQGLDAIHGEKQQKALPLEEAATAPATAEKSSAVAKTTKGKASNVADIASAVAFKPADLDKAKAFVTQYRTPTTAGVQNALSCGFNKAESILAELARQDMIIANDDGAYQMPPLAGADPEPIVEPGAELPSLEPADEPMEDAVPAKKLTKAQQKKADAEAALAAEQPVDLAEPATELTEELYEQIKAKVITDQKVSAGALAVFFNIDIGIADQAVDQLEMETVISEEDEMGGRVVFDTE